MPQTIRPVDLHYPLAGLHRRFAYQHQPPYTTPRACNVRPYGTDENRERGGSRPGMGKAFYEVLGVGTPIRMLAQVTVLPSTGLKWWQDTFDGTALDSIWSEASWVGALPSIMDPGGVATVFDEEVGAVRTALTIDTSQPYTVGIFIPTYAGAFHGAYRLYARLDDTTPDLETEGVVAELVMTGESGEYDGTLTEYNAGEATEHAFTAGDHTFPEAGWFTMLVTTDNIKCYWLGHELVDADITAQSGTRFGFGFECTEEGGVCAADIFRVQYRDGTEAKNKYRMVVASAGGLLYRESEHGVMEQVDTDATFSQATVIQAAEREQMLYIADYGTARVEGVDGVIDATGVELTAAGVADWSVLGIEKDSDVVVVSDGTGAVTDGTYQIASVVASKVTLAASCGGSGTCTYHIARAPKTFDPATDTVAIWQATAAKGQVPTDCPLICTYRDRLCLAGYPEHLWYMSRQGDPNDWDYAAEAEDVGRAVASDVAEAGQVGAPLTAMIPFHDDHLIFGCYSSLWRLTGDPVYGGQLNNVSQDVGIIDKMALCWTPEGDLAFLSHDGLYRLAASGVGVPEPLSRPRVPQELLGIDTNIYQVSLAFDYEGGGIHICVTPRGDE